MIDDSLPQTIWVTPDISVTTSPCRSCSRQVIWATTLAGKKMPVDPDPDPAGTVILSLRGNVVMARMRKAGEALALGERSRVSHFKTCPSADQHRHRR